MKYLKIINRPLGFAFPEKKGGGVDWTLCDISPEQMRTKLVQGHIEADRSSDYVSLLPLNSSPNDVVLNIIAETNGNDNPDDSADVIEQAQYDTEKALIEVARASLKVAEA
jgi:hypothetical protein